MIARRLHVLGLALALLGPSTAALADDDPTGSQAFKYELRALGAKAGEAVLLIGDLEEVGKDKLRPIRIDARTEGLAAKVMETVSASTTWVDGLWLPVRARWDIAINHVKRVYKTTFAGKKVSGTDERDGKLFAKNDFVIAQRGTDIVSVFGWIMNQDMTPGTRYAIQVYDGRRIYDLRLDVGAATEITLPIGIRKAIPIKGRITRGEYKRDVTMWLAATKDRAPLKLSFSYGLLGSIDAVLVSQRKVDKEGKEG